MGAQTKSSIDTLNVIYAGNLFVSYSGGGVAQQVYTHNLGYIPAFVAYVDFALTGNRYALPYTPLDIGSANPGDPKFNLMGIATTTTFTAYLQVPSTSSAYAGGAGYDFDVRFYLLQPTSNV